MSRPHRTGRPVTLAMALATLAAAAFGLSACEPQKPSSSSPPSPISIVGRVDHALSGGYYGVGPHMAFSSPAVADINADGVPDIVVAGVDGVVQAIRSTDRAVLWTRNLGNTAIQSSPTLTDLTGDGKPDVVVGTMDGRVVVINGLTGAVVRTFNEGAPMYCPTQSDCRLHGFFTSPAVADINGDGILDIIAPSYDASVYVWSSNGVLLWRKYIEDTNFSSPVVADIDNDGLPEIVMGGDIWPGNPFGVPEGGLVWVLRRDGTTYPGYPRSTPYQVVWSSPAVGDVDGDGNVDIVVGTGGNWPEPRGRRVDAFRARDRVNLAGWPVAVDGQVLGSPTLSDMDGDGRLEVTFAANGGWVYAYNSAGARMWRGCNAGEPDVCREGYFTNGGTVVADVDGDGRQEVISSLDKQLRIFDGLTGNVENTIEINEGNAFVQGSSPAVFALNGKAMIAQVSGFKTGGHSGELGRPGDQTRLTVLTTGQDLGRADWPQFHRDAARSGRYRTQAEIKAAKSFVTATFHDYIGRAPSGTELDNGLAVVGDVWSIQRRSQFTTALAKSDTYLGAVVNKLYVDTLGRTGDTGGVAYWTSQLRSGKVTVAQAAGLFYSSPEYFTGFGNNDLTTWVTDLYDKVLLRAPDQGGLAYYVDLAQRINRYTVAYPIYQSPESSNTRVKALYQHFLGRPADQGGLDYWASRIPALGDVALASNLTLSDEYLSKAAIRYP